MNEWLIAGYFGNVYKGIYREGAHPKSSHVAIKTLKGKIRIRIEEIIEESI